MASITIRRLDEAAKRRLRLRAARHGRSMEDEARVILSGASSNEPEAEPVARKLAAPRTAARNDQRAQGGGRVLLIIGGGIAAYKSLDLIRRLKERGIHVRCILTRAAQEFITVLSAGTLSGERAYTDLFDPAVELDVGHIRLAREADLIVVAPATADLLAKMASGSVGDLASAVLLAGSGPPHPNPLPKGEREPTASASPPRFNLTGTSSRILIAPAMNPSMWAHPATRRNLATLMDDGVMVVGPNAGEMAEAGEAGIGRMAEPLEIAAAAIALLAGAGRERTLAGRRVIVTSGPTHEPIDPVRYIANRSSGKQGHAIAAAAAALGAEVTLVSGPVSLPDPVGVKTVKVESAQDMLNAVTRALPADVAVFAAAVADWRVAQANANKIKKNERGPPKLPLVENPDILATVAGMKRGRPRLVIGFAAETEHIVEHAKAKLARKRCDWILANDVSASSGVMGGDDNTIHLVTKTAVEAWPPQSKEEVARALVDRIAGALTGSDA
jgi:phosphopantothenoylcysteine decarboxylase/phosphopantothenate--cysteine ligase